MSEVLYPRPPSSKDNSHKRYRVEYTVMEDEFGNPFTVTKYYRSKTWARLVAWDRYYYSGFGYTSIVLFDQERTLG